MILLQRTSKSFGNIDGSKILPAALSSLTLEQIEAIPLTTECGQVALKEVFNVSMDRTPSETFLLIEGDCTTVDGLATQMHLGTLCILGNVGDKTGASMSGGTLVISGDSGDQLGAGMAGGFIFVVGDCRHQLASPLPGKKTGMRGGDIFIAGSVGSRACERMRRGTVFVAGDAGDYCVPQMIAGSVIIMGQLGCEWGGGMRRGSLILGRDFALASSASLSESREFELSFLPLIWKHVEQLQHRAHAALNLAIAYARNTISSSIQQVPAPIPIPIPSTRWVQRQIADLNCDGRGEVLVLKRVSSPAFEGR